MRVARLAAVLVVATLAGGVAYVTALEPATPPSTTRATGHAAAATAAPAVTSPTTAARRDAPPTTSTVTAHAGPQVTAEQGLAAWGRFAVSGDLQTVAPWFSPDGPQWAQFEAEAREVGDEAPGDRPYSVLVEDAVLSEEAAEAEVQARVTFVRTGEASQSFQWRILLRREDDRWTIWTVEEAHSPSSTSNP